ncbi:MAG: hypothetical protein JO262_23905 [Solirubrobacterales bacterium]|nr:hypothetical protein [Solirubrobacterales bacterium]MBV9945189.1 hypothetical protein [Solirubrobacterales bacterium]
MRDATAPGAVVVRVLVALLTMAALLAVRAADARARAATPSHRVNLNSTMFAAQVGSTTRGASVYAGALPDPRLGHGAIIFSTAGTTHLRVIFQEFFSLGSIRGSGRVTLAPGPGASERFTGSLTITGGTGNYRNAHGTLSTSGTLTSTGSVKGTLTGSFTS